MPSHFLSTQRVEFSDTDMAGIVHFASYFRYMEVAEHAFFRSLGYSVHMEEAGVRYGWPRVHAECDFRAPLRFEDEFEVELCVREKREKSLRYEFIFRKLGGAVPDEVARGSLTVVCTQKDGLTGKLRAVPIPNVFASLIEVALETEAAGETNG